MNKIFKIINMCDSCIHYRRESWEYPAQCSRSPNCRFAEELLPMGFFENKNDVNAIIACTDYEEYL